MKKWKEAAVRFPRVYLFSCWLLLGLTGIALGAGEAVTSALILVLGYFVNILWMFRD